MVELNDLGIAAIEVGQHTPFSVGVQSHDEKKRKQPLNHLHSTSCSGFKKHLSLVFFVFTSTYVVWQVNKRLPYVSLLIVVNGRVLTMKSGGLASGYDVKCGSPIYQAERVDASGDYYASAVSADGRNYISSQRGAVVVLDATSDKLNVHARNELKFSVFASSAIVDGVIYLRTDKYL